MAFYLMRFSYTPETWSNLMQNPEDRRDAARAYIEQVGRYTASGMASANTTATRSSRRLITSPRPGLCLLSRQAAPWPPVETTVLMTVEETIDALGKGKSIGYRRPGVSPAT